MEIKKIQRVVKSTIAAETLALQEALETCYMIRTILLELYKKETDNGLFPIHCYTDNKLLLDSLHSTKTLKEKRPKVDVCIIREMLEKKEISSLNWCTSETTCRLFNKSNSIYKQVNQFTKQRMGQVCRPLVILNKSYCCCSKKKKTCVDVQDNYYYINDVLNYTVKKKRKSEIVNNCFRYSII